MSIAVRDIRKRFGAFTALDGISLDFPSGELIALLGPSGCGKTTALRCLAGLEDPDAGRIEIGGRDVTALPTNKRDLGMVFQAYSLFPHMTARQNVEFGLEMRRQDKATRAKRAADMLDLVGLSTQADRYAHQMSGGQQQRVALGVALANSPRVLLADEPTGELDTQSSDEVFAAIQRANAAYGTTVVVVTHDPLVSEHVQRTVGIRDGRTSSEVVRRGEIDEHGNEFVVAEEYAVLDRAGRLQLPREFTTALDMKDRVRLDLEADHIGVWPDGSRRAREQEVAGDE